MNAIYLSFLALLLCYSPPAAGQSASLSATLDELSSHIQTVETERERYEQSLTYDAGKPWRIEITVDEVERKRERRERTSYAFNLADIDPRAIKIETDEEEQLVILRCQKRRDFIRVTDDDGDVDYASELELHSSKIDQAKTIQSLFQEAARLGEQAWTDVFEPGETLTELSGWLQQNLKDVRLSESTWQVSWTPDGERPDLVTLNLDDGDDERHSYQFSLADLAKNGVELDVRGEEVNLELETINGQKLVRVKRDEELEDYEDEISIPVESIERARRSLQVFELALPLARAARDQRLTVPSELDAILPALVSTLTPVSRPDEQFDLSLSPDVPATLQITVTDADDGESETSRYLFDYADLNPARVELEARGEALNVVATTKDKKDFIQVFEEDEDPEFTDELTLPVADVETAYRVQKLLVAAIEAAQNLPISAGTMTELAEDLSAAADEDGEQTLSRGEDDCKWELRNVDTDRGGEETLYQFNLYDLDNREIAYEVSGDKIYLELVTRRGEEVINVYEDGEPSFTDEVRLRFASLAAAKRARQTVIQSIEACAR